MSKTTKWVIAIIVIALVLWGLWKGGVIGGKMVDEDAQGAAAAQSAILDTSDATIDSEAAAIDAQMKVTENLFSDFRYAPTAAKASILTRQFGDVGTLMTTLASRLQTRTTTLTSAGIDTKAMVTANADLGVQLSYAVSQIGAANTVIAKIKADGGNAIAASQNNAYLQQTLNELQKAKNYLDAGVKDIKAVIAGFKTVR